MTGKHLPLPDLKSKLKQKHWAWALRISLFAASFILTTLVFMIEKEPIMKRYEFMVGEPAPRTFFSPSRLSYVKEKETALLKEKASLAIPPVFNLQSNFEKETRQRADHFAEQILEAREKGVNPKRFDRKSLSIQISDTAFKYLLEDADIPETLRWVTVLIEQTFQQGIWTDMQRNLVTASGLNTVSLINPETKTEKMAPLEEVLTPLTAKAVAAQIAQELISGNDLLRNAVLEIYNAIVIPNMVLDEAETKSRRSKAIDAVKPVEEEIKKDELVVQRGMRITREMKIRLEVIQKELAKKKVLNKLFAASLLIFLTYFLGFVYLFVFEKKILLSFRLLLLTQTIFVLTIAICKIMAIWPGSSSYLIPAALAPLLLTLLVHPRLGMFSSAVMAVLVAPIAGFNSDVIVATLFSCAAGVFSALKVRKRIHFLRVGLAIGVSYFLILFIFQIFQEFSLEEAFSLSLPGLVSGVLITTPLAFLLLPIFEWLFNQTTDITLLELSDLNHPLLKRMIVEAPGTYHHSLVVSTLAESACEAIGANALLARVGCYFHDIGKIARAEYFTENMGRQSESRHHKLTPTMSCLIIMNHVKDGIELGRKHKLKERILQFIPEHQGTGVIYYFYKKAMDNVQPGEKLNVDDFRYPGPKPQSKETAVAMLSDSTEAASRSLKEPSPESIRQLVRKIINDKFIDGQLDECNLTLRDLHKIQESFVHNLMAIFHTRVSYPSVPESPDRPNLFKEDQFSKFRIQS